MIRDVASSQEHLWIDEGDAGLGRPQLQDLLSELLAVGVVEDDSAGVGVVVGLLRELMEVLDQEGFVLLIQFLGEEAAVDARDAGRAEGGRRGPGGRKSGSGRARRAGWRGGARRRRGREAPSCSCPGLGRELELLFSPPGEFGIGGLLLFVDLRKLGLEGRLVKHRLERLGVGLGCLGVLACSLLELAAFESRVGCQLHALSLLPASDSLRLGAFFQRLSLIAFHLRFQVDRQDSVLLVLLGDGRGVGKSFQRICEVSLRVTEAGGRCLFQTCQAIFVGFESRLVIIRSVELSFGLVSLRLGRVGEFFCLFNSRGLSGCLLRIGEDTLELAAGAFVVGFCFAPSVRVQEVGPGFFRPGYGPVEIFFVFLVESFFFTFALQFEGRFRGLLSRAASG